MNLRSQDHGQSRDGPMEKYTLEGVVRRGMRGKGKPYGEDF